MHYNHTIETQFANHTRSFCILIFDFSSSTDQKTSYPFPFTKFLPSLCFTKGNTEKNQHTIYFDEYTSKHPSTKLYCTYCQNTVLSLQIHIYYLLSSQKLKFKIKKKKRAPKTPLNSSRIEAIMHHFSKTNNYLY